MQSFNMIVEATEAGFYHSLTLEKKHSRIQILTIEELLNGKNIDCPPFKRDISIKKARRLYIRKGKQTTL